MIANLPFLPGEPVRTADTPQKPKAPVAGKADRFAEDYARTAPKPRSPSRPADQPQPETATSSPPEPGSAENPAAEPAPKPPGTDDLPQPAADAATPGATVAIIAVDAVLPLPEQMSSDAAVEPGASIPAIEQAANAASGAAGTDPLGSTFDTAEIATAQPAPAAAAETASPTPEFAATSEVKTVLPPAAKTTPAPQTDLPAPAGAIGQGEAIPQDAAVTGSAQATAPTGAVAAQAVIAPVRGNGGQAEFRSERSADPANPDGQPITPGPLSSEGKTLAPASPVNLGTTQATVQGASAPTGADAPPLPEDAPVGPELGRAAETADASPPDPVLSQAQIALALRAQADGGISDDHFRKLTATTADPVQAAPAPVQISAASDSQGQLRSADAAPVFRDPATAAQVSSQLAASVQRNGNGSYDVALSPPELGHVKITLQTHDKGIVVAINADRPETMDLIRRHVDQLARDFRELGYDRISFSFGSNGSGTSRQDSAPDNQTWSGTTALDSEPAPTVAIPVFSPRLTTGQLDIKF